MAPVAYKCPNCASPLTYDGASGKMLCAACDSQFDQEAIEALNAQDDAGVVDFVMPTEEYTARDAAQMQAYHCKSCGAELITEGTTTATECPYCGSPTILPDRIDGGIRPEMATDLQSFHHPRWAGIDLNSGFESAPGVKKAETLRSFLIPNFIIEQK